MYSPEGRHRCAERAGPTPETRGAHAGHTRGTRGAYAGHALCVRRLSSNAHLAHHERTPSVLLTHAQRAQRSSSVFLACGHGLYKRVPPHPLITFPSTLMGDDIDSCWSCLEELHQKLDDPDRLQIQYEIAVLQHQQDLLMSSGEEEREEVIGGSGSDRGSVGDDSLACMTSYLWNSVMKTRHLSRTSCGCPPKCSTN